VCWRLFLLSLSALRVICALGQRCSLTHHSPLYRRRRRRRRRRCCYRCCCTTPKLIRSNLDSVPTQGVFGLQSLVQQSRQMLRRLCSTLPPPSPSPSTTSAAVAAVAGVSRACLASISASCTTSTAVRAAPPGCTFNAPLCTTPTLPNTLPTTVAVNGRARGGTSTVPFRISSPQAASRLATLLQHIAPQLQLFSLTSFFAPKPSAAASATGTGVADPLVGNNDHTKFRLRVHGRLMSHTCIAVVTLVRSRRTLW
jgi:hypothetical protein